MNENRVIQETDLISVERLRQRLNQILETMWTKIGTQHQGVSGGVYVPDLDVGATDDVTTATIDLPGVAEKDIEVLVSADGITVQGEKRAARERKGRNYYISERAYGSFRRTFALPPDADGDKTTATMEDGTLTITVPKKPGSRKPGKPIPVTSKS